MSRATALWRCETCGEQFTTRNQSHSCGRFELDPLFVRSDPGVRRIFDAFLSAVREVGPVRVIPQRTRIALQVRMRFAALMPQKRALKGHLVLARPCRSRHFTRVETYSPRNHVHVFRLMSTDDLDAEFRAFMAEAYRVGCREHVD
jgi:hypothetical protein